jgi:hypothetical protein
MSNQMTTQMSNQMTTQNAKIDSKINGKIDSKIDSKIDAKETLVEAVQRTEREYQVAASVLLEAKDTLANVQARVKEAQDNTMRAQMQYTAAKERHMMSIIQQQNEQIKGLQNGVGQGSGVRLDNVDSSSYDSNTVVVDMKGQPFLSN